MNNFYLIAVGYFGELPVWDQISWEPVPVTAYCCQWEGCVLPLKFMNHRSILLSNVTAGVREEMLNVNKPRKEENNGRREGANNFSTVVWLNQ